jgi:hypothetical protein
MWRLSNVARQYPVWVRSKREGHCLSELCTCGMEGSSVTEQGLVEVGQLVCIGGILGELERCARHRRPSVIDLFPGFPSEVVSLVDVIHCCHERIVSDSK